MYNVSHDEYVSEFDPKHSSSAAAAAVIWGAHTKEDQDNKNQESEWGSGKRNDRKTACLLHIENKFSFSNRSNLAPCSR